MRTWRFGVIIRSASMRELRPPSLTARSFSIVNRTWPGAPTYSRSAPNWKPPNLIAHPSEAHLRKRHVDAGPQILMTICGKEGSSHDYSMGGDGATGRHGDGEMYG